MRSFTLSYRAVRQSDGVAVAEVNSVQVWLDTVGKPTLLPEPVRQALLASLHPSGGD